MMLNKPSNNIGVSASVLLFAVMLIAPWGCDNNAINSNLDSGISKDVRLTESGLPFDTGPSTEGGAVGDAADGFVPDGLGTDACTPTIVDCTNLCGPITDNCSGITYECGGCPITDEVCDLMTNICVTAKATCADFNAECGSIKNNCGERLDCGDCPSGQECDGDTNVCVPCTAVTCQDLGYACGSAWLGCGPRTNKTDCGSCPSGQTCNPYYLICESACTPLPSAQICANAQTSKGIECGTISDGCGGYVDCGSCPTGTYCGVRGVANRCETPEIPPECIAQARDCGTIQSACGTTFKCGDCAAGLICNTNGKCGPPCSPKTCASDFVGQCGTQLDDGCNGKINCGCPPDQGCDTLVPGMTGTCVTLSTCVTYNANGQTGDVCSNGASPSFSKGNGTDLTCPCSGSGICVANQQVVTGGNVGTCCTNTATCSGSAVCSVINTCTGAAINCCGSTQYCDSSTNSCKDKKTCADYTDRQHGSPCSTTNIFPDGSGDFLKCTCASGGICQGQVGTTPGTCCFNTATCSGTTACSVTNSCTGAPINCCSSSQYCNTTSNTCVAKKTCADYTSGESGDPCSTSPLFDDGTGTLLTCPCDSGGVCQGQSGSTPGTCCFNTAQCDGTSCTVINTCTGATINCCGPNQYCDPATNTCVDKKTCSYYTNGQSGSQCSTSPLFDDGTGTLLTCPCASGGVCIGQSGTTPGTCCFNTATCTGTTACSVSNTCTGATINCCTSSQYCDTATNTCVAKRTCSYYTNGQSGSQCSTSPLFDDGTGTLLTCPCSSGGVCQGQSGSTPGTCCVNAATCTGTTACSVSNTCTGATINCCSSSQYCDTSTNTCASKKTCSYYNANGAIGNTCSTVASSAFPVGDGTNLTCNCSTSSGKTNNICVGSSSTTAGTCQCTPKTCDCTITGTSDGCGSTLSCACTTGQVCNPTSKTCVTQQTCASYGANGDIGDPCSTVSSSAFPVGNGTNLTCNCSTSGGKTNNICVGSSSTTAGSCQCTPDTCRGRVGVFDDLCGGSIVCSG